MVEEEVPTGKVLEKLLDAWELPHFMQISAVLFSLCLTVFSKYSVSLIAEAVFVMLIITSGNVFYRAVSFKIIYTHSWQTIHASLLAQIHTDM